MLIETSKSISFLIVIITIFFAVSVSGEFRADCGADFNFTRNSAYEINRDEAFSSVITSDPNNTYGFYNRSVGEAPDQVNVIALCRGDIEREDCQRCINDYGARLREFCPNKKQGNIIYDTCMIRYSDQILLGSSNIIDGWDSGESAWNPEDSENATDVDQFTQALDRLWVQLRDEASSGGSLRKYASNVTDGPRSTKIYGLMQCTPDISATRCYNCLTNAINRTRSCCDGKRGARVLYLSCNIRYQDYPFFNATVSLAPPSSSPLPPSALPPSGKRNNTTIIVVAVVGTVGLLILAFVFFCVFIRRKRKLEELQSENLDMDLDEIITAESLQRSFGDIRAATDDFSENNKLGQGGFGLVYKGKLRNGQEIAVKRLSKNSGQGELEFKNEVLLLARLQHRNLVRLLGFSLEGSERLLMYEFVQNASLDQFIFDPVKRATLDWETRYKIIQGVARGLLYLHEDSRLKIIHRDMKASNVLLDADMNAKIADFGMARLFTSEETQGNTSRIVGTYGYMAPEYVMHGQFSVKSDVFSFGVLVLEIVAGRKNHSFQNESMMEDLLSHAWKSWRNGTSTSLIDPTLNDGSNSLRDMIRCIHIGLLCVQEDVTARPTMASVVLMLSSVSLTLTVPSEPAFFMRTFINSDKHFYEEYTSSTNDSRSLTTKSRSSQRSIASSERSITDDVSKKDVYHR
ncbi:cysteine-rich receptor-like protein kinase 15 [Cynara cardunculus var. scolymus]|uniref:cysteine-rich receptor-like protein kinase 15 n=1 Tax=Cynara cardunculus var. scolymus TaxID=59895 RepID=UPI000D623052|nr:cysteine-rich receptor-like protein kinase 15 [Cynara cardunculus var. scolymus]